MPERFISERIEPDQDSIDTSGMTRGEPGLPQRFRWRDTDYSVAEVLETWKERGAKHGEGEKYTRKHWYRLRTSDDTIMTIYFERQARSKGGIRTRWWVYTVEEPA